MANIRVSIDVTKIDKALLFQGKKGTYLNLILWENDNGTDEFGNDFRVDQDMTKEQRAARKASGLKNIILGNGKNWDSQGGGQRQPAPRQNQRQSAPAARKPAPPQDPDLDQQDEDFTF